MPSNHGQRKYFNTWMKLARLNETLVEYWMGHSLGKVRGAHFIPPVKESYAYTNWQRKGWNHEAVASRNYPVTKG